MTKEYNEGYLLSALELSQGLETAALNVKELKPLIKREPDDVSTGLNTKQNVYEVSTTEKRWGSSTDTVTCFPCGIAGHLAPQCKLKEVSAVKKAT